MKRLYLEAMRPLLKKDSQAAEPSSFQLGRLSTHGYTLRHAELKQQQRFTTVQEVQGHCLVHVQQILPNILLLGICLLVTLHCMRSPCGAMQGNLACWLAAAPQVNTISHQGSRHNMPACRLSTLADSILLCPAGTASIVQLWLVLSF